MSYRVHELPRAIVDVQQIGRWLAKRSVQGSAAWIEAYEEMVTNLSHDAGRFAAARETYPEFSVKQALFKTRKGSVYRALFFIDGHDVYILRVRGPGQGKVEPDDMS